MNREGGKTGRNMARRFRGKNISRILLPIPLPVFAFSLL
jgi:hypothetical protein